MEYNTSTTSLSDTASVPETAGADSSNSLFGTLEIEGQGVFYVFVSQSRTRKVWSLTTRDIFDKKGSADEIVSILRIYSTGKMEGCGKTYLLARLLDHINTMVGRAAASDAIKTGFGVHGEYDGTADGTGFIRFRSSTGGSVYTRLEMAYEGFRLDLNTSSSEKPFKVPKVLAPVADNKDKAAMVAGLGVRTFSLLRRQRGHRLDWYDKKDYRLVTSNEQFRAMMLDYLRAVQAAADSGTAVLTALDTETTGLNMLDLAVDNPARDHVVAIPFGWQDDKAYVICTDMYYFNNVDAEEVYPIFHTLFSRNADYTGQDIELDYCGEHFKFNRKHIILVGANVGFDIRAFMSEGSDTFFDEDIQIMHYLLATDWVQGKNSLKYMTHRYFGDETLELEDLFGPQHKDKYRYISDPELAKVYGGADADYPRKLFKKFRRLLPDNLYRLYKKYDMTTLYRTAEATWKGMPVDEKGVKEQGEAVLRDLETLKDFIYKYAYAANRNNLEEKAGQLSQLLGFASTDDVQKQGEEERMYRYPFTPNNHKHLLFNILGYPVVKMSEKSQTPALDKFVLGKLVEEERETPSEFLLQDIPSEANPDTPLISKKDFNKLKYPLALVFKKYAEVNKEYTAYYKPIMTNDLEGRMFYNFSLQRAATRRILSPGQTMKGSLKRLVIAPRGKLFMCFDASQIEYRHMASLAYIQTKGILQQEYPDDWERRLEEAGITRINRMMTRAEADYHIETASMMTGKPQYMVTPKERKMYKSIGFGIPYGLGDRSMCESLFKKVNKDTLAATKEVLAGYKKKQHEIIRLLESVRDSAFMPASIDEEFREMLDIGDTHVGIVQNFVGFYRLFILQNLSNSRTSRIRRQAGNCVIQGGAAELFRRMIYNFYMGCVEAGVEKSVQWLMLVHDEVDCLVDDDIDVCKMLEIIQTSCTLRYKDHIPYYVGIGFGYNWHGAKDDAAELPVVMVDRIIEAYRAGKFSIPCDGRQPDHLMKLKRHYMCDRVGEELMTMNPRICDGYVWTEEDADTIARDFTNYIVRAYLPTFVPAEVKKEYKDNVPLLVQLEYWQKAREEYGFGNDFLSEKLVDGNAALKELSFDEVTLGSDEDVISFDADDMRIDILENEDEGATPGAEQEGSWYDEDSLFDYDAADDSFLEDSERGGYRFVQQQDDEDTLEVNSNPSSAFDVYVSKTYVRKHIYAAGDNAYTIMLTGTSFSDQTAAVAAALRKKCGVGDNTFTIIGNSIKRITDVGGTAEQLDSLDKIISGEVK